MNAAAAASEPSTTPSMVADRATRQAEMPAGARAYFQPMLREAMQSLKVEIRDEIGKEFDKSMVVNFASLNQAMDDTRMQTKQYVNASSSELIAKFDTIFNAKSIEIEKQLKALETNMQTAMNKLSQNGVDTREFYIGDEG